jgi:ribosomal protein S6
MSEKKPSNFLKKLMKSDDAPEQVEEIKTLKEAVEENAESLRLKYEAYDILKRDNGKYTLVKILYNPYNMQTKMEVVLENIDKGIAMSFDVKKQTLITLIRKQLESHLANEKNKKK